MNVDDPRCAPYHCPSSPLLLNVYVALMRPAAHSTSSFHRERSWRIVRRHRLRTWRACHIWPPCAVCVHIAGPPSKPPMAEVDTPLDPYQQRAGYLTCVTLLLSSPAHIQANLGSISSPTVASNLGSFLAPLSGPRPGLTRRMRRYGKGSSRGNGAA